MSVWEKLLMQMFGHPTGVLGALGGRLMSGKAGVYRWVLTLLEVQPTDQILEVGFGPGVGIACATEAAPRGKVAGVDYSEVMVRQASSRNAAAIRAGQVTLTYGSAMELPHGDSTFDKALSVNSMHFWPDAETGLHELYRVLKPGGKVAIAFTPHARQSMAGTTNLLTKAGFRKARLEEGAHGGCAIALK